MTDRQEGQRVIPFPHGGIVVLVGPSNSGKTTLLRRLVQEGVLLQTEIVSSDDYRTLVGDVEYIDWKGRPREEADILYGDYQLLSNLAFEAMNTVVSMRCRLGKLTVVDATHLQPEYRRKYIDLAAGHDLPCAAWILDLPEQTLLERDKSRDQPRGRQRVKQQFVQFKRSLRGLRDEGFDFTYMLKETESVQFIRKKNPLLAEIGAGVDVIGDIHGCYDEMLELLGRLGYTPDDAGLYRHPDGRTLISVGDVMSRGPKSLDTMRFWKKHCDAGTARMIDSNHGWKIARYLSGRQVTLGHGDENIAAELAQLALEAGGEEADALREELKQFLLSAPSHLVLCREGVRRVVVAHAGIRDEYIGKQSKRIQDFCRYGDTDGLDATGAPVRKEWYVEHESGELIVWGHDPRPYPTVVKNTVNIDQGAVFGGSLTAYRYPEQKFVSVKAYQDYARDPDSPLIRWERGRFSPPNLRKLVEGYSVMTDAYGEISVRGEFVKAAIDTVSHFTIPMEELVYIPPTMSPAPAVSADEAYLEHPREAIAYYRSQGVKTMVAEKKHMGSRAVLLLFRDEAAAVPYVGRPTLGTVYTRTGRAFFGKDTETEVLSRLSSDLHQAGYWARYDTDLLLLDAEIIPWNLKARELIATQYAHVAEAAAMDREQLLGKLREAENAGRDVSGWVQEMEGKLKNARVFREAFQQYCWDTSGLDGVRIAPFHTLAHSGRTFFDQSHLWHMEHGRELAGVSPLFMETEFRTVTSEADEADVIRWWEELTEDGHEGIVIKPETFIVRSGKGLIQPAIKVRGRKYLHIIYGMDYLQPDNLARLKLRKTGKKERHALMECALSVESVERFIRKEPLERMHECVLAALSLESDPVDPRL
ncbi:polynucleotide kinase-phosphatase [Paenibacillus jilunlii]|uniref:Diadenosine tetraphosphatase n=1 Tax=Paenibacillus jilunlii TaxID=682956 RepID=A0A1G9T2U3_9BACL|nr:polynucleotide kinase-phosphatase [Paenibacillus jilunlii]KWX80129.1 diadenosine tetraphosphatase [Paenibacillus jilunlii]SDM41970.1 polynucleotide kinase-phosphatase [Paenibacillus jilunlii]